MIFKIMVIGYTTIVAPTFIPFEKTNRVSNYNNKLSI